jgi:hypothetical protein
VEAKGVPESGVGQIAALGGELLAKGEVLEREFGTGSETRAKTGEHVQEQGERGQVAHDAISCSPSLPIRALTDGKRDLRMRAWRGTTADDCRSFYAIRCCPVMESGRRAPCLLAVVRNAGSTCVPLVACDYCLSNTMVPVTVGVALCGVQVMVFPEMQ